MFSLKPNGEKPRERVSIHWRISSTRRERRAYTAAAESPVERGWGSAIHHSEPLVYGRAGAAALREAGVAIAGSLDTSRFILESSRDRIRALALLTSRISRRGQELVA